MTSVDEPLAFDEARLRDRLGRLALKGRLVFVASCAERASATCIRFAEEAQMDAVAELVRSAVEGSWRGAQDPEMRLRDRAVADGLWRYAGLDNDWNVPMTTYVPDCASAIYFAADFQITGSIESGSEAARWVYNAVDALASNRLGPISDGPETERMIAADRAVQRELLKQQRDLEALEGSVTVDRALIDRLRADSARLGRAMLDDFEAEASGRLRRGPPPRLYPESPS